MLTGGVCWLACAAYLVKKLSSTNNVSQLIKSWNSDITPLASCNSLKILKQFLSGLIWKIFGWGGVRQYLTLYLKIIKVKIMPHAPHVHTHTRKYVCYDVCVQHDFNFNYLLHMCIWFIYYIYIFILCIYIINLYKYIYTLLTYIYMLKGFPGGSAVKNLPAVQEMQETWVRSLGGEDPLEVGMATHSSILAWKTPWTEEPGGLWSIGSQRVGHDCSDWACTHVYMLKILFYSLINEGTR